MYRVVTKYIHYPDGLRRLAVINGPWHPEKKIADKWANFLWESGRYDEVTVESRVKNNQDSDNYRQRD